MIQDYEKLVEKISKISGKEEQEITGLVDAKRDKLSGLISREGAAQIVANELGINFDKEQVKIDEIMKGQKNVNTVGKIIKLFPVNNFEKNGRKGKVVNFIVADETGNIRTVLWDANHIKLIENSEIKEGDVVEISNGRLRESELHLSSFSDIKKSDKNIEDVEEDISNEQVFIKDSDVGKNLKTRAVIVQIFDPKFFKVCPNCGKKVERAAEGYECKEHGKMEPKERALLSLVLDDGSDSIRAVMFSEQIEQLGINHNDLKPENFSGKRGEIEGGEFFFIGRVKQNKVFNNTEMLVNNVQEVDIDKLIEELESNEK